MNLQQFLDLKWSDPGGPEIQPPSASPVVADPSFLLPEETPDGRFQLFAHTIWGIHRFESDDGLDWKHCGLTVRFGMRPFIRKFHGIYYLYYERYPPFLMPLSWLPVPWHSRIEVRTSKDLIRWSSPKVCIKPGLPWHKAFRMSASVSNPCVVETDSGFRMYYSASLVFVPDCGFSEPAYIGIAEASSPEGPWKCEEQPILSPDPELPGRNMGCGSIKVFALDDGWIGLQNGIFLEAGEERAQTTEERNRTIPVKVESSARSGDVSEDSSTDDSSNESRSRSALFLLTSRDGKEWEYGHKEPLIRPTQVRGAGMREG